ENANVVACGGPHDPPSDDLLPLDLGDGASIAAALDVASPDVVFHLAAQTFVPDSYDAPLQTYDVNVMGTARLAQAVRAYARERGTMPRIVFASSAEVYGIRAAADFPLRETLGVRPANPYAASKAAAEAVLLAESRAFGLDVVVARAFNHVGPGQNDRFVVPSFARQLANVAAGAPPQLFVGNLDAKRDFLDVRDVVRAYAALARDGDSGEIYNVCSGNAVAIRDVLRELVAIARVPVEIRQDPQRMRPLDVPLFVGSAEKLTQRTGWRPAIALPQSLRDLYRATGNSAQSS
ncbi:MAG TPA: GDP-mannose 4,6-dehydratase, partial [Candidatus Acidoferrales bacterium]|nr:GDP-mannose 4,6-dehydratase [Candidatus Acidoferrales bacterium]